MESGGGRINSDAGALLLRNVDQVLGRTEQVAAGFEDGRDGELIEHAIQTLVMQRNVAIALSYEDRTVMLNWAGTGAGEPGGQAGSPLAQGL